VIAAISRSPVHGEKLSIRIGIATGLVVVGAPIGEGDARQQTAIGETPNLAARLQGLATPNNLVIADSTRTQIGSPFDLEGLGARPLAGFAEPKRAWRVIDESGAAGRCEALRSDTMPLIGRGEELELLLRRWHQAKAGDGRVALISGEPGIGKSRLTAAVSDEIHGQPHRRLRWFCSPHHRDSALYPTIAQLERAAGFARDDSPEAKLAKARDRGLALLASLPETAERDAREIEFQLALGLSSLTIMGTGSPEMIEAYGRARQLAERHGDDRQLFRHCSVRGSTIQAQARYARRAPSCTGWRRSQIWPTMTRCVIRRITAAGRHFGRLASRWRLTRAPKKGAVSTIRSSTARTVTSMGATILVSAPA
jgi:hypothetical protein